ADGFTSGDLIDQSDIVQAWSGGGIPADRLQLTKFASLYANTGDSHQPTTGNKIFGADVQVVRWPRFGTFQWMLAGFKHIAADAPGPSTFTLDDTIDWRRRMLRV